MKFYQILLAMLISIFMGLAFMVSKSKEGKDVHNTAKNLQTAKIDTTVIDSISQIQVDSASVELDTIIDLGQFFIQ